MHHQGAAAISQSQAWVRQGPARSASSTVARAGATLDGSSGRARFPYRYQRKALAPRPNCAVAQRASVVSAWIASRCTITGAIAARTPGSSGGDWKAWGSPMPELSTSCTHAAPSSLTALLGAPYTEERPGGTVPGLIRIATGATGPGSGTWCSSATDIGARFRDRAAMAAGARPITSALWPRAGTTRSRTFGPSACLATAAVPAGRELEHPMPGDDRT